MLKKSGRGCGWFVGLLEDCIGFVRVRGSQVHAESGVLGSLVRG